MDIMAHPTPRWTPLARTAGGSSAPRPAGPPGWDPLGEATDFTVGVVDTGVLLTWPGRTTHPWLTGHVAICPEDDEDRLRHPVTACCRPSAPPTATAPSSPVSSSGRHRGRGCGCTPPSTRERSARTASATLEDRMVAAAIRSLALDPRVQVINLSFGGGVFEDRSGPPVLLGDALAEVDRDRVAVVAAAGNEPSGTRTWPAAFHGVIGVGAGGPSDDRRRRAPRSATAGRGSTPTPSGSRSRALPRPVGVGAAAPSSRGGDARGRGSGWATWSGTSFAAATVSGRIAAHALEHGITGAQAADRLLGSCEALPGEIGRLVR